MATFILVHGAWHGGWCWERVVPLLEARGHAAHAPDLLGMGADRTPLAEVTLEAWARQVADLAAAQDGPPILVGHSRGGIVISQAAELAAPGSLAGLVYLTAFLVPDGRSSGEVAAAAPNADLVGAIALEPEGVTATLAEAAVGPVFYQTTAPEWLARTTGRFTPEPLAPSATPLRLTAERFGAVPRAYIEAVEDRAIRIDLQRAMHAALPCDPVISLPTDHSPFYSAPEALTDALIACAEAFSRRPA